VPDSQGQRLKLQAGDVLVTYDGEPVTDMTSFIYGREHAEPTVGTKPLVIRRQAEELTVEIASGPIGVVLSDHVAEAAVSSE
jgi:hypothetical protein